MRRFKMCSQDFRTGDKVIVTSKGYNTMSYGDVVTIEAVTSYTAVVVDDYGCVERVWLCDLKQAYKNGDAVCTPCGHGYTDGKSFTRDMIWVRFEDCRTMKFQRHELRRCRGFY